MPNGGAFDVYIDGGKTTTASVVSVNGNYTFGRLTLDAGDTVNVADNVDFVVSNGAFSGSGSIVNNGTLNLNSTGSGVDLRLAGPVTLATNSIGEINLTGVSDRILANNAGDRLTINQNVSIQGTGNLGNGTTTFTNNGTVTANVSGATLTLQPGGGSGDFTNKSTLSAQNGGTLAFSNASGGTLTNNGILQVLDGSTLNVPAGALTNLSGTTLTGGDYSVSSASASNPATLSLGGGSIVTNNASIDLSGPGAVFNEVNALANNASGGFFALGNHNFTTAGALTNAGSVFVATSTLTVSGSLSNSGQAIVSDGGSVVVQGNTTNSGVVRTQGGTFTVQGALNSSGVLQTSYGSESGTITATGTLTQTAAGTLAGSGSVTAPTLVLAGSLRPGDNLYSASGPFSPAVGTLTLNGQVELTGNTTLIFDLAGTTASDEIEVDGALTLEGTLNVNAMAGFGAGRYDLIDYTGTLTNDGLALGTLPSGYNYALDTSMAGQVDLVVTNAVPEPSTWAGGLLGLGLLTLLRRRDSRA